MSTLQTLLALVVLIYVLCVIVQAIQEVLKSLLDTKAKTMQELVTKYMGKNILTPEQIEVALKNRGLESLAALEHLNKDDFRSLLDTIPFSAQQIQEIPAILGVANATVDQFKDQAAAAYDSAMAKFQQLYAAHNKRWVIAISFVVVLALNASVIKMYEILTVDQEMTQAIAGTASTVVNSGQPTQNAGAAQTPDLEAAYSKSRQLITEDFRKYPILLRAAEYPIDIKDPFNEIGGLIIMGILVSLGAPFWNDVLKGVTGVNNALNSGGSKKS